MISSIEGKRVAPYAGNTIKLKPPVALVVCTYFKIVNYLLATRKRAPLLI